MRCEQVTYTCDRCGAKETSTPSQLILNLPAGWMPIPIEEGAYPYDLCPECHQLVLSFIRGDTAEDWEQVGSAFVYDNGDSPTVLVPRVERGKSGRGKGAGQWKPVYLRTTPVVDDART